MNGVTSAVLTCEWCSQEFDRPNERGPAPKFCSNAHRQAAHRGRQIGSTVGIDAKVFEGLAGRALQDIVERNKKLIADMGPKVDPKMFGAGGVIQDLVERNQKMVADLTPKIDPKMFGAGGVIQDLVERNQKLIADMGPKIDPKMFGAGGVIQDLLERHQKMVADLTPKMDPKLFEGLAGGAFQDMVERNKKLMESIQPKIDPEMFDDLIRASIGAVDELSQQAISGVSSDSESSSEPALLDSDSGAPGSNGVSEGRVTSADIVVAVTALSLLLVHHAHVRAMLVWSLDQIVGLVIDLWTLRWHIKSSGPTGDLVVLLIDLLLLGVVTGGPSARQVEDDDGG